MKVGFIGLGNMGSEMALNLINAGHEVTAYNRTASKIQALVALGAHAAAQATDACRGDVVITMLADDAAVEALAFGGKGIIAGLGKDGIHISMSTISVALSERLAAAHAKAGQRYVSAPVFGRPEAAIEAKLFIASAGPTDSLDACMPLFEAMGQETFRIGNNAATANLVKLSGNFLIASVIESLGEALALVSKAGVDRHRYIVLLTSSLFALPVYKTYGGLLADGKFSPASFGAPLGLKDVGLTLSAAETLRVTMPLASLLRDRLLALVATGGEKERFGSPG